MEKVDYVLLAQSEQECNVYTCVSDRLCWVLAQWKLGNQVEPIGMILVGSHGMA